MGVLCLISHVNWGGSEKGHQDLKPEGGYRDEEAPKSYAQGEKL